MKGISLKQELAIMANTRGYNITARYAVNGKHYSSLKTAISQAKKSEKVRCYVTTATGKTITTIIKKDGFFEVIIW
jgi:hypothetical protein